MKKILLLGNHGFVIYNFRKELIKKLIEEGNQVYVSLPYDDKVQELVEWGCYFVDTKVDRRGTNPFKDMNLILHYIKIFKNIRPDVVLTYTIKPNLYGGLISRILNIPCINNITGLGSGFSKNFIMKYFLKILYRVCLKKSYTVFFQNSSDMNNLIKHKIVKNNYELLPGSGVNLNEFEFEIMPEKKDLIFVFVGRIMKDKGIDQYLEAARYICKQYSNIRFDLIGFVEKTEPEYNQKIKEYHNKGYINYLGYKANIKPYIKQAHCLIQPSHGGEGISNVLLEAASIGRPLIASSIPGCKEVIEKGKNGFIFNVKNENSLIEKIKKFIEIPHEEKNEMGKNSRKKVEAEFNRDFVVKAYLNKIEKI